LSYLKYVLVIFLKFAATSEVICVDLYLHIQFPAWASTAVIALAPLQDVLGLGSETRINTPGVAAGNWMWRYKSTQLTSDVAANLRKITKTYFR
jgi:4-alpha-glucanotransferase